jgi:hypothetical protein
MKKRRFMCQRDFVAMLLAQGARIPCPAPGCGKLITDPDNIRKEHLNALAISNDDSVGNQQLWHLHPCAHRKTYGTKATTLGSDAHAIAKGKRMNKELSPFKKLMKEKAAERRAWVKDEIRKRKAENKA